ncbi:MAG: type VI secretion system Vgr family protein [Granulosicoccus sp.]
MSMIDQASRAVRVFTPLSDNTLAVAKLSGSEQISELFTYTLDCVSEDANIDLYDLLGMNVSVEIDSQEDGLRYVHALVSHAAHVGSQGEFALYRFTLTAWPWMLKQTSDCRIYADMNVPDIIAQVFNDNGFSDFDNRLMGSYDSWNFCVQYQETDFDFVSRLMEHEGIYYHFEHHDNRHVMVLCDDPSAHNAVPDYEEIPHYPETTDQLRSEDHLVNWQFEKKVQSGKYAVKDFAFDKPKRDLLVKKVDKLDGQYDSLELYDFPGGYSNTDSGEMTRDYGERLIKSRMEALSAHHEVANAEGNVRGLNAGNKFKLINCERDDQNREYLIVYSHLKVQMDAYDSGAGGGSVEVKSSFRCMPSNKTFRPLRHTPKPQIRGPQTAIVVGKQGEEIWTDQHGRVKLQFHWDRYGKSDENSSCWVRVSQAWAGEKWGSIHIPRIGQEVIVEYIDGDPDRPIVTGRVYNGDRPVPYDLPANATQSGIKSRSSKGGKPANFNEIRMEDKKGAEELYFHAEKDQTTVVENDRAVAIGHDHAEQIGHDCSESIGNNRMIDVAVNHTEKIGANMSLSVGGSKTEMVTINTAETVKGAKECTVGAGFMIAVGGSMSESVGGDRSESVGNSRAINVSDNNVLSAGGDETISIGKSRSIEVADDQEIKIGGKSVTSVKDEAVINAKKIQLVAKDEISFKVGSAQIVMKKNGDITIKGKKINVKGSGDVVIKGSKIKGN